LKFAVSCPRARVPLTHVRTRCFVFLCVYFCVCVCAWVCARDFFPPLRISRNPSGWQQNLHLHRVRNDFNSNFLCPFSNLAYFNFSENNYITLRHTLERKSSFFIYTCMYIYKCRCHIQRSKFFSYGVATISRLLKIIGLF